jgi:hypothetical protein
MPLVEGVRLGDAERLPLALDDKHLDAVDEILPLPLDDKHLDVVSETLLHPLEDKHLDDVDEILPLPVADRHLDDVNETLLLPVADKHLDAVPLTEAERSGVTVEHVEPLVEWLGESEALKEPELLPEVRKEAALLTVDEVDGDATSEALSAPL